MAEVLNVSLREEFGTNRARKLRNAGKVPAVVYGHGEATVSIAVPAEQIEAAIRHGSHLVELQGAVTQSALISDVQWDPFGVDVLHIDFTRVVAGESVEVTVPVELRGDAPGAREGGIINHVLHEITMDCPVSKIVDKIEVNVNSLHLNDVVTAGQLELPEGAKLMDDADAVVVQCVEPIGVEDEEAGAGEAAEPEVIGRKAEEEEGED
ncbi:MAG: 50S ribosomal protein L25 [Pirellulaceae bacterium]